MTVQYSQYVLTGGPGVFFKLLLKWRGSVFKLIYIDLIIFGVLYTIVSCVYRFALPSNSQRIFERLVLFTYDLQTMIPVAFILGFYINLVFNRFWTHFLTIPWALKFSMLLVSHLPGKSERSRLMRRTCIRYVLSSLIITATRLHLVARKRFPTPECFVSAGILSEEELKLLLDTQPTHVQPFIPIIWVTSIITLAERDRLITNRHALTALVEELNAFRQGLLNLFMMDHVCVPLVYTQVVTLAVYSYFAASLIGRQYIVESSPYFEKLKVKDLYFPFFTVLEFIIYVGWLKVAETLVNPMGEDDEDIDINEVIDFNWKICWSIVDGMRTSPPAVVRDMHWDQPVIELPHTEESRRLTIQPFRGSVYDLNVQCPPETMGSMTSISMIGRSQDFSGMKNLINPTSSALRILSEIPNQLSPTSQKRQHPDATDSLAAGTTDGSSYRLVPERKQSTDNTSYPFDTHSLLNVNKVVTETIVEEDEELENTSENSSNQVEDDTAIKNTTSPIENIVPVTTSVVVTDSNNVNNDSCGSDDTVEDNNDNINGNDDDDGNNSNNNNNNDNNTHSNQTSGDSKPVL